MSALEQAKQFLAGCFHENWSLDHATPESAIREYWSGAPAAEARLEVARHLERLAETHAEVPLREALYRTYGCDYLPAPGDGGARLWLRRLATILRGA